MKQFVVPTRFIAVDNMSKAVSRMSRNVEAFGKKSSISFARAERSMRALTSPLQGMKNMLGNVGIYLGGWAVFGALKKVFDVVADFQQMQVNIASVTHKSIGSNKALADQARSLALQYGVAADKIAEIQYNLIKLGGIDVISTTQAALVGAKGLQVDPEQFSHALAAAIKNYDGIVGKHGEKLIGGPKEIADQMVKIADITGASGQDLITLITNSGAAAAAAKVPFPELLSMYGLARDRMLHAASASTALKNIFIDNATAGKGLEERLNKIASSFNELKKANQLYNKRSAQTALVNAQGFKSGKLQDYMKVLNEESSGYAFQRAEMQLNSMRGAASKLSAATDEMILSWNDGSNSISTFYERAVKTISGVFYLSSTSERAAKAFEKLSPNIQLAAKALNFFLQAIIDIGAAFLIANVALGAWGFLLKPLVPLVTLLGDLLAAAGQSILLIFSGVSLGTFGAVLGGAIGIVYILSQAIETLGINWSETLEVFKSGDIWGGLNKFANMIFDLILYPMQKTSEYLDKLTGGFIKNTGFFKDLRKEMGINVEKYNPTPYGNPVINQYKGQENPYGMIFPPSWSIQDKLTQEMNTTQRQKTDITINNKTGYGMTVDSEGDALVPIKVNSTFANWGQ